MADDLEKLVDALRLARRNQSVVNHNLALSAIVIGGLVIGAVLGAFSLPVAVLGHEISEFIVIGRGLRMLKSNGAVKKSSTQSNEACGCHGSCHKP